MQSLEANETIKLIRQYSRQLVRELDVLRGEYLGTGYTFLQCHILFELSNAESLGLMELSEILLMDKSNTSRTTKKLVELGLVKSTKGKTDSRKKRFSVTAKGTKALQATIALANDQVNDALVNLTPQEQQQAILGMKLYANALCKSRIQSPYSIRPIAKKDNKQVAEVIRSVMTEFGAVGVGYSIGDREVDDMYANYQDSRSRYLVVAKENEILGCGGIAPLKGGGKQTCELRKMFFLPEIRGLGLGKKMLLLLMEEARQIGFKKCYLETLKRMDLAVRLYEACGFRRLEKPRGNTGHCSCDLWYSLDLS